MVSPTDIRIIHTLQKNPLLSFRKIAEIVELSPQTVTRRMNQLKVSGFRMDFISSFIPEKLSLTRYIVVFQVANYKQCRLTIQSISKHYYVKGWNRFFGKNNIVFAYFDIPNETLDLVYRFLEILVENNICRGYEVFKSLGYRDVDQSLLPHSSYKLDIQTNDLKNYWEKYSDQSQRLPKLPPSFPLPKIDPVFIYVIYLVQTQARIKQFSILNKKTLATHEKFRRDHIATVPQDEILVRIVDYYFDYLKAFFSEKRKYKGSLQVDLNRKYNYIVKNIIYNPRLSFPRDVTPEDVYRAYIFNNVNQSEINQIFNLFSTEKPPFPFSIELAENLTYIRTTLPPYLDAAFHRIVWKSFPNVESYASDFYDGYGVFFPIQINNFDYENHNWRTDDFWLLESPFIEMKEEKIIEPMK